MTTPVATTHLLDANDKTRIAAHGEMDEAIAHDIVSEAGLHSTRIYYDYELFDLHTSPLATLQRRLITAYDGDERIGECDEILAWLSSPDAELSQDKDITLKVAGQTFIIQPATAEQRLHLLFLGNDAPEGIGQGIAQPLRVDNHADPHNRFDVTALDNLYLYGTPQFQARVYEQLLLLPGYPALKQLLDTARQRYETVPDMVLMQCYAGPAQFGPGFDLERVIPNEHAHRVSGDYTAVLYDPYEASGLDGLTTLARLLQQAYDALAPDVLLPAPVTGG